MCIMRGDLMWTCLVWAERSTPDNFWVPSYRFNCATGEQKGNALEHLSWKSIISRRTTFRCTVQVYLPPDIRQLHVLRDYYDQQNVLLRFMYIYHYWGISSRWDPLWVCRLFFCYFSFAGMFCAHLLWRKQRIGLKFAEPYLWTCFRSR